MSKFSNPFGRLTLTRDEEQRLEAIADMSVRDVLTQYQQHLVDDRGEVDCKRWKFVKRCENVNVFQDRQSQHCGAVSRVMGVGTPTPAAGVPVLMGVGTIAGDLEDVMYGVVSPTQDMIRLKTSYVKDHFVDAAVLATVIEPSVSEPFRSLTVKWSVKGRPLHVRTVIKNRDFVYLESTGIATLAGGERIGYQLLHSVKFTQIRTLDTVVRGNVSIAGIFRQQGAGTVALYMRGFLDPAGGLMRSIVVKSAAEAMMSVNKNAHCAQMKKLAWVIRRSRFAAPLECEERASEPLAGGCGTCSRRPKALQFASSSACKVCGAHVCGSCRVKKTLSFIAPDRRLVRQRVAFCGKCVGKAFNTSAHTVASDEILAKDSLNGFHRTPSVVSIPSTTRSNSVVSIGYK